MILYETNRGGRVEKSANFVVLKIPEKGKTLRWNYPNFLGDNVEYTCSWETIDVYNKPTEALKLITKYIEDGIVVGTDISHYVEGIGLWSSSIPLKNGNFYYISKFDGFE